MGKSSLSVGACTSAEAIDVESPSPRANAKSMKAQQLDQLRKKRARRCSHQLALTRDNAQGFEALFIEPVKHKEILVERVDANASGAILLHNED